jgi:hypothetical protein
MDDFEKELVRIMRDTHDNSPFTDTQRDRVQAGVHRRRRVRGAWVAGGCLAAVAGLGAVLPSALAATAPAAMTAAAPSTSAGPNSARPSSAPPTGTGTTSPGTAKPVKVSAEEFGALFASKLPASLQLSDRMVEREETHAPQLVAVYAAKDGDRNGAVEIDISKTDPHGQQPTDGYCSHPVPNCTTTTEPDGSTLTVYLPAKDAEGGQLWIAMLSRPDGSEVSVTAGNKQPSADKPHQNYANSPLLDGAQLSKIALDPAWLPLIAGLQTATVH